MMKKSLLWGAAALLVLCALGGCSNPASSDTIQVTQAGSEYPFPADTVQVDSRAALDGLLNEYNADTNKVRHIAYNGISSTLDADLVIPPGKTVYLTQDHTAITGNITVSPGARLVLVGKFTAGAATKGFLLVKGSVEVFRNLTVTTNALDVADYTVENKIEAGRNTVIGKNVSVLPGATLTLKSVDIIPPDQNSENKFTPAQAWAAAGQGNLEISGTLTAYPYTVKELLSGVSPSWNRTYKVESSRITAETLPALIPAGANIITSAIPEKSDGNTLTVNGRLSINGTLNDITEITVGSGGSLNLSQASGDILEKLTGLTIRAGAGFNVITQNVTLKALRSLFLGDGSRISVPGNSVSFTQVTGEKLETTLGQKVYYHVGTAVDAVMDVKITDNASLLGGSSLIMYPGSTFTLAADKTLTIESNATVDFSALTPPANPTDPAPAAINGVIVVEKGGTLVGPAQTASAAILGTFFDTIELAADTGKVILDWGSTFGLGPNAGTKYVGASSSTAAYEWAGTKDGAQIEINAAGLVIRNIAGNSATVTIAKADTAGILKGQSLTMDTGVELSIGTGNNLWLIGGSETEGNGAILKGNGKITAGKTTIIGGAYGWQAVGDSIVIEATSADESTLKSDSTDSALTTSPTATLKALGSVLGAVITQAAAADNELNIAANTTIALGGTAQKKVGEIVLTGDVTAADRGKISLADASSLITTGNISVTTIFTEKLADDGNTVISGSTGPIGITNVWGDGANAKVTTTAVVDSSAPNLLPLGNLVSLQGATGAAVTGGNSTPGGDGKISSETVTNKDDTV
jgi:hypothetical protein